MENKEIKQILLETPAKVRAMRTQVVLNKIEIEDKTRETKKMEFEITKNILMKSLMEEHKKELSNAEKRQVAVDEELAKNMTYTGRINEIETLKQKNIMAEIELEYLKSVFNGVIAVAYLGNEVKQDGS